MDVLGNLTGFPGLFVACLFSGALSTVSSGLSALAAVVLEDVLKTYIWKDMSERRATLASKILALIFGVTCLGLTYIASLLGGVLQAALSLFGMIGGPLLGLFILGMMFPWSNKWGAYAGLFLGLIFMFWIGVGAQIYPPYNPKASISTKGCNWNLTTTSTISTSGTYNNITSSTGTTIFHNTSVVPNDDDRGALQKLYSLSYMWYSATAVLTVVVIGLIVSFITGPNKPEDVDPYLICPLFDILFPYLPEKIKKPMRFGVKFDKIKHEDSHGGPLSESDFNILDKEMKVTIHDIEEDKGDKRITSNGHINGALSIEKLENNQEDAVQFDETVTKL